MDELMNQQAQVGRSAEDTYSTIRGYIISAQNKVASAVNTAMVLTYHEIGEQMYKACGENDRAAYGKQLLQYLSERLTSEFGKGFNIRNLQMMRKILCTISKCEHTVFGIELVTLSPAYADLRSGRTSILYGGMFQIRMECPSIRTADPHDVLSTSAGQSGQGFCGC